MSEDFPEPSQSPEIRREDSRGLAVIRSRTQKLRSVSTPAAYTNSDTQDTQSGEITRESVKLQSGSHLTLE